MNQLHVDATAARKPLLLATLFGTALLAGCGGGGSPSLTQDMQIVEAGNGFGQLLPHRVFTLADGQPTSQITLIRTMADLMENVTPTNPILPNTPFEVGPVLPTGDAGNHYFFIRFTQDIDLTSLFDQSPNSTSDSNLLGSVQLVGTDPDSGVTLPISARFFVDGFTVGRTAGPDGLLPFEQWVAPAGNSPVALEIDGEFPGLGFPGTQIGFPGAAALVRPDTLVAVADLEVSQAGSSGDLTTLDAFPQGLQLKLEVGTGLRSTSGNPLISPGVASSTVGLDTIQPELTISTQSIPEINPGAGMTDVDPQTTISVNFSEPVQPTTIGALANGQPPADSSAIEITFGPDVNQTEVPYNLRPFSVFDLTSFELIPGFAFPGSGPAGATCGTFSEVEISVNADQITDLVSNINEQTASTTFETGDGPGLVNAPVAPDVIYLMRSGSDPGVSVLDLNGFGQSTGNFAFDPLDPAVEGASNFPNNPNVATQANLLIPPLANGECTFNGGSQGVFSLTTDSSLNNKLIRAPLINAVGDMMIGQPLDITFNNGPPPFGCQAGTPNLCASTGLKVPSGNAFGSGLAPAQPGQISIIPPGTGNLISWAPHPNPPPLVFPPPCTSPLIAGQEPTSIDTVVVNLLTPLGDPFGSPEDGIPPQGLLANTQNVYFLGPSLPQPDPSLCTPYSIRQQVGHFLYMIDPVSREIVVLNSNRFSVIDRISLPDPTSLAMSPNVDILAVTNRTANLVSLIDIDPRSATFHEVIQTVPVGEGPFGIAWQPDNEDILVCNELDNSMSIISVFSLEVRETITTALNRPFEVAVAPRQGGQGGVSVNVVSFHLNRSVYFAYILNRTGRVSFFESGPNGPNGYGTDTVVGQAPFIFDSPQAIALDIGSTTANFFVLHQNPLNGDGSQSGLGGGAVSQISVTGTPGLLPLSATSGLTINLSTRQVDFNVLLSVGEDVLTGVPVDLAFDNQVNFGGVFGVSSIFSPGTPVPANHKGLVTTANTFGFGAGPGYTPRFMFVAIPNSSEGTGAVDVLELNGGLSRFDVNAFQPGIQSVSASGVTRLSDYFRQ
ncbi:MAG: hypothetical protein AAFZ65_01005 [Planctomycetota bacterium]